MAQQTEFIMAECKSDRVKIDKLRTSNEFRSSAKPGTRLDSHQRIKTCHNDIIMMS